MHLLTLFTLIIFDVIFLLCVIYTPVLCEVRIVHTKWAKANPLTKCNASLRRVQCYVSCVKLYVKRQCW